MNLCVWWSSQTQHDVHTRTADDDAAQDASAIAAAVAASALGAAAAADIEHEEAAHGFPLSASGSAPIATAIEPSEGSGKRKRDQQEEQEGADEEPAAGKGAAAEEEAFKGGAAATRKKKPVGRKLRQCTPCKEDKRNRICNYKEGGDPRCER
jgi:hypothetical protein